jgi:hypothetical protein
LSKIQFTELNSTLGQKKDLPKKEFACCVKIDLLLKEIIGEAIVNDYTR